MIKVFCFLYIEIKQNKFNVFLDKIPLNSIINMTDICMHIILLVSWLRF